MRTETRRVCGILLRYAPSGSSRAHFSLHPASPTDTRAPLCMQTLAQRCAPRSLFALLQILRHLGLWHSSIATAALRLPVVEEMLAVALPRGQLIPPLRRLRINSTNLGVPLRCADEPQSL